MVEISASDGTSLLSSASGWRVCVYDAVCRRQLAERLGATIAGLLKTCLSVGGSSIEVCLGDFPIVASSHERLLACFGVSFCIIAQRDRRQGKFHSASASSRHIGCGLHAAFAHLRKDLQLLGTRDVLDILHSREQCAQLLTVLLAEDVRSAPVDAVAPQDLGLSAVPRSKVLSQVCLKDLQPLKFVTWNVGGSSLSRLAPATFTARDKRAAFQQEVRRWMADVVALQEVPDQDAMELLADSHTFVGSAASHAGFIHLYVRRSLQLDRFALSSKCPAVAAHIRLQGGGLLDVVAVHFASGAVAGEERRSQLQMVLAFVHGETRVILGDMNVRPAEVEAWSTEFDLQEAPYAGQSWNMRTNRYFDEFHGLGFKRLPLLSTEYYTQVIFVGNRSLLGRGALFVVAQAFVSLTISA